MNLFRQLCWWLPVSALTYASTEYLGGMFNTLGGFAKLGNHAVHQFSGGGCLLHCGPSGDSTSNGSIGSLSSLIERPFHRLKLLEIDDHLGYGGSCNETSENQYPPVGRRVTMFLLSLVLCHWCIDHYRNRGDTIPIIGIVLLSCCALLLWMTFFRWTWGWWL
jgi:hypothetical protein